MTFKDLRATGYVPEWRRIAGIRRGRSQVLTTHNHMINEQPRLLYSHFWAVGDAATLARALRAALDRTR